MAPKIYIANQSGNTEIDGVQVVFHRGRTRVPEGHPILAQLPVYFDLDEPVLLGAVEAPQAPPEPVAPEVVAPVEPVPAADPVAPEATTEAPAPASDGKPAIPADKPATFADVKALAEAHGIDLTNDKNQARSGAKLWDDLVAIRDGKTEA